MKAMTRGRLVAVPLVLLAAALPAPAGAASPPFRHDLALVDGHLRIAVAYAPAELAGSLEAAEVVCHLGEAAAARGEAALAAADWATLGQLVDEEAVRQARRIDLAFTNADSALVDLGRRYGRRWGDSPARLRELRRGVGATRRGIAIMRAAIAGLASPFASWRAHECDAATRGGEAAFAHLTAGLGRLTVGMLRLWRLAAPVPGEPGPAGMGANPQRSRRDRADGGGARRLQSRDKVEPRTREA